MAKSSPRGEPALRKGPPWATLGIILVFAVVYFGLEERDSVLGRVQPQFTYRWAAVPCEITQGIPVTLRRKSSSGDIKSLCSSESLDQPTFPSKRVYAALAYSLFIHRDTIHLLTNMAIVAIFGKGIERSLGPLLIVMVFLGSGILAGLPLLLLYPDSPFPIYGASDAAFALIGAFLVLFPHQGTLGLSRRMIILYVGLLVISEVLTSPFGVKVGHLSGFAVGAALGYLIRVIKRHNLVNTAPEGS